MNEKDFFVIQMRENTQLRTSFSAYLADLSDVLMREMVSQNDIDKLRMAQGSIRGLARLEERLHRDIGISLDNTSGKGIGK